MRALNEIRGTVREKRPLIHCITNPISINQCANTVLAAGARPIMAEHPAEVKEITETADALMQRVNAILASELEAAVNAIRTNQHILDALVEKLKEQNYLRKTEIREICRELVM